MPGDSPAEAVTVPRLLLAVLTFSFVVSFFVVMVLISLSLFFSSFSIVL